MNRRIVATVLLMSFTLISVAGCTSGTGMVSSATPEDAFETMREAAKTRDWNTFLGCMTPNARNKLVGMMVIAGTMMTAELPPRVEIPPGMEKASSDVKALFDRYGIGEDILDSVSVDTMADENKVADVGAKVSRQSAFFGEMSAIMEEAAGTGGPANDMEAATLSDVTIDGDSATGKITMTNGESAIDFKKIDGTWLVEIPTPGG